MDGSCICNLSPETKGTMFNGLKWLFALAASGVVFAWFLPMMLSRSKSLLEQLKANQFGIAILLYIAFWINMLDFSTYGSKEFVTRNIVLLAGLLALKHLIWASKYILYGIFIILIYKLLKKFALSKVFATQLESLKENLNPAKKAVVAKN